MLSPRSGGLLMEAIGDQDCARRASAYAKLAEEPSNLDFREQYLHLARAWMDLALEQAPPRERHLPIATPA
jgi:hypothetical protein